MLSQLRRHRRAPASRPEVRPCCRFREPAAFGTRGSALRPDLVLTTTGAQAALTFALRRRGYPVFPVALPHSPWGVLQNAVLIGDLLGLDATQLVDCLTRRPLRLKDVGGGLRVYVEFDLGGPITIGRCRPSYLAAALRSMGLVNVYQPRPEAYLVPQPAQVPPSSTPTSSSTSPDGAAQAHLRSRPCSLSSHGAPSRPGLPRATTSLTTAPACWRWRTLLHSLPRRAPERRNMRGRPRQPRLSLPGLGNRGKPRLSAAVRRSMEPSGGPLAARADAPTHAPPHRRNPDGRPPPVGGQHHSTASDPATEAVAACRSARYARASRR